MSLRRWFRKLNVYRRKQPNPDQSLSQKQPAKSQRNFQCAICNIPGDSGAFSHRPLGGNFSEGWLELEEEGAWHSLPWNDFANLVKCHECGRYYCDEHKNMLYDTCCKLCKKGTQNE